MHLLSRTLAIIAFVVAGVLGVGLVAVLAQTTESTQRTVGGPRTAPAGVTPPPLPFGDQSRAGLGEKRSTNVGGAAGDPLHAMALLTRGPQTSSPMVRYMGARPPIPKLSDLLHHRVRWKQAANGGSIVLTGTGNNAYLDDQTIAYQTMVFWLCQNLTPNATYQYILFSPDGYGYIVNPKSYTGGNVASFQTDASGRCLHVSGGTMYPYWAQVYLETPLQPSVTSAGTTSDSQSAYGAANPRGTTIDPAYSGVWAIAVQNTATNAFEAVAYTVVIGTLNFNTYSNAGLTTPAKDFTSGSNVYVSASGLNPSHFYAFGLLNTSGNGLPCLASIPTGAQNSNNGTCFLAGATGVLPTNGTLSGQFATPATGANSAGTYTVQLFDATTNDLISTQQISVNPSTVTWNTLQPYNGATIGTNLNDAFATDGLLNAGGTATPEQSVTGLNISGSGTINGHVYQLTMSNSNGVIMSSSTSDNGANTFLGAPQFFSAVPTFTATGTTFSQAGNDFPINATNFTAYGPTQIPFAPNVYTVQLYDRTAGAVVGSKSFKILGYNGFFQWTNPAGAYVNTAAANAPTNVTTTLRNDAGVLYGSWNADSIKAITISGDSGGVVTLGRQTGVTTTTDSSGQTWNIAAPVGNAITITPNTAGQALAAGGTIPLPITVAAASGVCTSGCILRTSITPLHGINPSAISNTMTNNATNGLVVYGFGVVGTNAAPSYSLSVGAYSTTTQLPTPRYKQMMYDSGTNGATGGTYTMTINVNDAGGAAISDIEFVLPSTVDPTRQTPSITNAIVNGANQTGNWSVQQRNIDPTLAPSAFSLVSAGGGSNIPAGKTATFTLTMPILLGSFPFQEISALANHSGTAFNIGPTNAITNAIAGTSNIDSTELAVFSLSPALMNAIIAPAVVPALAGTTATFKFINTSTGLDPNPDYISQLLLTVPTGAIPSSITVSSPNQSGVTWNANLVSAGQWLIDLCTVATAPVPSTQASTPCSAATDANSLPPGAELDVTFHYTTAPTVGTYPINWTVVGANGGGVVAASGNPPTPGAQVPNLVVANTTAQASFTFAGGYTASPAHPPVSPIQSVPNGSQPVIGSWSNYNEGNGYVFELHNNGSTTLTDVSLAIPWANTSGQLFDTAYPWSIDGTSIYVYGAGAGAGGSKCVGNNYLSLVQAVNGAPGTSGLLRLSGCNVAVGQNLDMFFYAKNPYDVGSTFRFDASVATGNTTPPDPRTANNANTLPIYSLSNTVRIIADARLVIQVPTGAVGGPFSYNPALMGGSAANPTCVTTCVFSTGGALPVVNFGNLFSGTATAGDGLAASVYSDSTNGWNLSVAADVDTSAATGSGQLKTWLTADSSAPGSGTYTKSVTTPTFVTTSSLPLSTFTGAALKRPIDNLMSYSVTISGLSVNNNASTTVTLTYTLVAN